MSRRPLGPVGLIIGAACAFFVGCDIVDDVPVDAGPLGLDICDDGEDCSDYDEAHALVTVASDTCRFLTDCCLSDVEKLAMAGALVGGDAALQTLLIVEPDFFVDNDACIRGIHRGLLARFSTELIGLTAGRRAFDEGAAEACFADVAEAADRCAPVLLLLGEVVEGVRPVACDDVYAGVVAPGDACGVDADCDDTDGAVICDNASRVDFGGEGEGEGVDVVVAFAGVCAARPVAGDACPATRVGDPDVCEAGTLCLPDRSALVTVCQVLPPGPVDCDVVDVLDLSCGLAGTCITADGLPGAGTCFEPCVFGQCADGATCLDPGTGPVCLERFDDGADCGADDQCDSDNCDDGFGVCVTVDANRVAFDACLGDGDNRTYVDVRDPFDAGFPGDGDGGEGEGAGP